MCYDCGMEFLLLVLFVVAVGIAAIALKEDKIFKGYNPEAVDRDGDGWIQEGTKWERPTTLEAKKKAAKRAPKKAAPAKKAAAKKKTSKKK